ncbi:TPA: hypothetical protein IAA87_01505 [Candidatus Avigastranaerophilus faecigallinarum]|nr:hypothetical protein [Candidatus Avigastranaerophilus faecigallinarum]
MRQLRTRKSGRLRNLFPNIKYGINVCNRCYLFYSFSDNKINSILQ